MKNTSDMTIDTANYKALLLGDFGTGKSSFAATFPSPGFLFSFDSGAYVYKDSGFEYEKYPLSALGWIQFEKDCNEVCKAALAGKYATIIIDPTTSMQEIAMERALQIDPKRSPSGGPLWNVHYSIVKNLVGGRIRQLMNLPVNLLVIGHLRIVQDQDTGAIISIEPLLTGQLAETLPGGFGEVYCFFTRTKDSKPEYYLRTAPLGYYKARSTFAGKNSRIPLEVVNPTYEKLISYIKGAPTSPIKLT